MKTWRSNSSEARLRAIQVKQEHARQMKIYLALFTIFLLVSNNKGKKNEKTPETMSAMSDFEMEDPDASKTQVTTGPFLESPDN